VIKFALHAAQTIFNITQTLSERKLCKTHYQKLLKAIKTLDSVVAIVSVDTLVKLIAIHNLKELRKNVFALVHLLSYVAKNHFLAEIQKFSNLLKLLLQQHFSTINIKLTGQ
jgi:hypothetical protein